MYAFRLSILPCCSLICKIATAAFFFIVINFISSIFFLTTPSFFLPFWLLLFHASTGLSLIKPMTSPSKLGTMMWGSDTPLDRKGQLPLSARNGKSCIIDNLSWFFFGFLNDVFIFMNTSFSYHSTSIFSPFLFLNVILSTYNRKFMVMRCVFIRRESF